MIETGKVRVFRQDEHGVELTLSELGPGQSFGEIALLTGEPRSANVETVEESQVVLLAKEQFDRVGLSKRPFSGTSKREILGSTPKTGACS